MEKLWLFGLFSGDKGDNKVGPGPRGGGGELADFYDGGDHVRPFSQTPKYADQIFQRPQIC